MLRKPNCSLGGNLRNRVVTFTPQIFVLMAVAEWTMIVASQARASGGQLCGRPTAQSDLAVRVIMKHQEVPTAARTFPSGSQPAETQRPFGRPVVPRAPPSPPARDARLRHPSQEPVHRGEHLDDSEWPARVQVERVWERRREAAEKAWKERCGEMKVLASRELPTKGPGTDRGRADPLASPSDGDSLGLVWGAEAIGALLGVTTRRAFHLLEQNAIPARKVAGRWVAARARLREFFQFQQ